jgi:serine/threonine protein kinase
VTGPGPLALTKPAQPLGQLGRYRLIQSLGVGGMAEVFKAHYAGPGGFERTVVVKRILPAYSDDAEFARMFTSEAKILGMLHHPNVVQAYDFGEADGTLFLVIEYVDGPSIARLLRAMRNARRPIPVAIAAQIARDVCRALDYVHNLRTSDGVLLNVIHRDVTPSNIVMTSSGSLKLLDFGIAKYGSSEVQTRHHTVKGKPAYLAPEIIEGEAFDARVDLFSLGVVLHEILTLVPLFAAENDLLTLRKVLTMTITPPSATRAEVPAALDAIVMKALARDPGSRYASAAEMARDLDEFVVSAHLHNDVVIGFVREAEALLAQQRQSASSALGEPALATLPTEPEADPTKRDLVLRLRMSPIGRLLFGRNDR